MKLTKWMPGTLLALPLALLLLGAEDKEAKCPISGKPAKGDICLSVNGKKVAFCCKDCCASYKKDLAPAEAAATCPVSGKPVNKETAILEKTAESVAFCCGNCQKDFLAKSKLEAKDEGPKKCPVSGHDAKKEEGTSLNVNGKMVYFCCKDCVKGYLKDLGIDASAPAGNCPASGKPAKAETAVVVVKAKEVAFCCSNCQKAYIEKNFKDGVKVKTATKL